MPSMPIGIPLIATTPGWMNRWARKMPIYFMKFYVGERLKFKASMPDRALSPTHAILSATSN